MSLDNTGNSFKKDDLSKNEQELSEHIINFINRKNRRKNLSRGHDNSKDWYLET